MNQTSYKELVESIMKFTIENSEPKLTQIFSFPVYRVHLLSVMNEIIKGGDSGDNFIFNFVYKNVEYKAIRDDTGWMTVMRQQDFIADKIASETNSTFKYDIQN